MLAIGNMYPPHALGGYERVCADVLVRFAARGHDVTVLTTTTRLAGVTAGDDGPVEVRRELQWYWDDHALLTPSAFGRWQVERHNQRMLARALRDVRPDIVSIWNMGAMSLGLVTTVVESGLPSVVVLGDEWLGYGPSLDPWLRAWTRRPRLAGPARHLTGLPTRLPADLDRRATFCFVSSWTLEQARRATPWTFPDAEVVPHGIEPTQFPPRPAQATTSWSWQLLWVGRVEPRKGTETAIRALAALPAAATLRVVGPVEPAYGEHLRTVAAELGVTDRVSYDVVAREQLGAVYRAADAVLFTPVWDEPFGLVPLEAMASGVPVVGSATGGSADFLDDGVNALTVPRGDDRAVAAAVQRLATDPELRARLGAAGRATAQRFTVDVLADTLEDRQGAAILRARRGWETGRLASAGWAAAAPVASVVIATHDRAAYLPELLAALDAQTLDRSSFEVVVVDDGSADDTWATLTRLVEQATGPLLALRLAPTGGPSQPRNAGAAQARSPYLLVTDDDCLPAPGWAAALLAGLQAGADVVQGRTGAPGPRPSPWSRSIWVDRPGPLMETCNVGYRMEAFAAAGEFPVLRLLQRAGRGFGEDAALGCAVARAGGRGWAPDAYVTHRWLPGGYRDHLAGRRRLAAMPALARAVPEVADARWLGVFASRRTARTDLAVAALAAAALRRRATPLVLAMPWLVAVAAEGRDRAASGSRARLPVRLAATSAQVALADLTGLAALAAGSVRARTPML